jgi:hypothetical protein
VSPEDPIAYVLSLNLHRRHLTASQLSIVADKARAMYDEQAKERMNAGKKGDPVENLPQGKARDQAGKAVGVSGKLVDAARQVREHGIPELYTAVEEGRMAVTTAAVGGIPLRHVASGGLPAAGTRKRPSRASDATGAILVRPGGQSLPSGVCSVVQHCWWLIFPDSS